MQALRRADKLHVPGGAEDGVLLAQQAGGWVLHPSPQILLPRLLAVWTATQGPTQSHPRPLHCSAHPGHPPHDSPGSVEEQTQRGDCVVEGRWGLGSQNSRQEILFVQRISFSECSFWGKGFQLDQNHFIMDLEEELDKINLKPDPISVMLECTDTYMKPLQLPSLAAPLVWDGLKWFLWFTEPRGAEVDQDSDCWKTIVNIY